MHHDPLILQMNKTQNKLCVAQYLTRGILSLDSSFISLLLLRQFFCLILFYKSTSLKQMVTVLQVLADWG